MTPRIILSITSRSKIWKPLSNADSSSKDISGTSPDIIFDQSVQLLLLPRGSYGPLLQRVILAPSAVIGPGLFLYILIQAKG